MSNDFKDFILDQLADLEGVRAKRMFGGFGLYAKSKGGEVFFGIISGGELYFKTNTETKRRYEKEGSGPFAPSETQVLKNYWLVPADVLENPNDLLEWANEAIGVAEGN